MRPLAALFVVAAGFTLTACGSPCQDLGDRLCQCAGSSAASDACKTEVKNQLKAAGVTSGDDARCTAALNTCNAPSGTLFCEWITTSCGKAQCGLTAEPPASTCTP